MKIHWLRVNFLIRKLGCWQVTKLVSIYFACPWPQSISQSNGLLSIIDPAGAKSPVQPACSLTNPLIVRNILPTTYVLFRSRNAAPYLVGEEDEEILPNYNFGDAA